MNDGICYNYNKEFENPGWRITMKRKNFFGRRPVIITIIAVVVLLALALISSGGRTVTWIESLVGSIVTPVQTFAQTVSNSIVRAFRNLFNTTDADKENAALKAKVAELEVAVESYEELRQENERLKELLNYAQSLEVKSYVTATVIANSNTVWFNMFTINAGRNDGIETGDAVVNGDGLIGIVSDVGATWCKVRSIVDPSTKIGVIIERTRDNGFIRGTLKTAADTDELELYFMPSGSDLTPGDVVITSGLGSDIPRGITIGTVSKVMRVTGTGTNETNAVINPSVDFLHIEDVMVITSSGD